MTTDHVLIAGAGFGGLDVAIHLKRTRPDTPVTLVNPSEYMFYRPWLIYLPAQRRRLADLRVPLAGVARRFGITLRVDSVTALEPDGKAHLASGERIAFSHAVVATGARSDPDRFPGADEHAFLPCEINEATWFAEAFQKLHQGHVTIVAGGERPGPGLEYAGWLMSALERPTNGHEVKVQLVDEQGHLAKVLGSRAFAHVVDHFAKRGHAVVRDATVSEIGADHLRLADGRILHSDLTAVVGPLRARDIGLPPEVIDERGFVTVGRELRSTAYPNLFAVGDAAALPSLPKSMMMARRQAKTVADNVARALDGTALKPFDFTAARRSVAAMPDFGGRTVFVKNRKLIMSGRLPLVLRSAIDRSFFRTHNYGI